MDRRGYLGTLAGGAVVALAGCTTLADVGERLSGGEEYDVGMSRNAFEPAEYEATVGDRVVWKNTSGADHTITALENSLPEGGKYFATGGFDGEDAAREAWRDSRGGRLEPRGTYGHTFEVPGTYDYVCIPHVAAGMAGTVVVTE